MGFKRANRQSPRIEKPNQLILAAPERRKSPNEQNIKPTLNPTNTQTAIKLFMIPNAYLADFPGSLLTCIFLCSLPPQRLCSQPEQQPSPGSQALKYTCYTRPDSLSVPGSPFSILPSPRPAHASSHQTGRPTPPWDGTGAGGKNQTGVGDEFNSSRTGWPPSGRKGHLHPFLTAKPLTEPVSQLPSDPRTS